MRGTQIVPAHERRKRLGSQVIVALAVLTAVFVAPSVDGQTPAAVRPAGLPPPAAQVVQPLSSSKAPAAPAATAPSQASGSPSLTKGDVDAWLDGIMPVALNRSAVAGAVVVVVKDGQVLTERGFGSSDLATGAPVDPQRTLFRPGSVSKLFTWTAVMQQVEAGKINLDADVNTYLDYRIPPRDGKPITMRNLMTHTPGFEEAVKNLIVSDPKKAQLGPNLKRWIPHRIYAPGTTPAYSNYGAALAGYIVERVSGEPFDDYIARHILKPLGMDHSTFAQPLAPSLAPLMSKGYANTAAAPQPFEIVTLSPAGALTSTGDDMARFMIAHLQDGRYGDAQILKPETAREMHATRTSLMAPLNGIELGFYDQDINGHHVIAHGGDTQLFHSNLLLFLDDGVGLFVSQNSSGVPGGSIRDDLFEGFANRYFPGHHADRLVDAKTAAHDAKAVAGVYVTSRGARSSFLALGDILSQTKVLANADGTVSVSAIRGPAGLKRFREIGPYLWREVGGQGELGFVLRNGRPYRFSFGLASAIIVWDRAPAAIASTWLGPALFATLLILLAAALGWPLLALVRWRYGAAFAPIGQRALAYRLVRAAAVVALLGAAGWLYLVSLTGSPHGIEAISKSDTLIIVLSLLTLLGTLGGLGAAVYNLAWAWTTTSSWLAKLWSVLLLFAFAIALWAAWAGKLLSFSTNF